MKNPSNVHDLGLVQAAGYDLFPLRRWDEKNKDGQPTGKLPYRSGWQLSNYSDWNFKSWLLDHHNVGVKLHDDDLVVDVDTRSGGAESLSLLEFHIGKLLMSYPMVRTGSGGLHIFMKRPPEMQLHWQLAAYPGIDFQSLGRYVVAAGSTHPNGRPYHIINPQTWATDTDWWAAPEALLALLRKEPRVRTGEGGELSVADLERLLAALDPRDFGTGGQYHNEWLNIAMAAHDGTNGDGLDVWLDWCAKDPHYGDGARSLNERRWNSFESGRGGSSITFRTLMKAVTRAGRPDLVREVGLSWDPEDDPWED